VPSIPRDKLNISHSRSAGPGGQNVNKLNTQVDLKFNVEDATWIKPEALKERFLTLNAHRINNDGEYFKETKVIVLSENEITSPFTFLLEMCGSLFFFIFNVFFFVSSLPSKVT